MISFHVNLIKVPPMDKLSGWHVFELMVNATHIGGDYWIFEGDVEALNVPDVELVCEGITEGTGGLRGDALRDHCADIFNESPVDLRKEPPDWKMTTEHQS